MLSGAQEQHIAHQQSILVLLPLPMQAPVQPLTSGALSSGTVTSGDSTSTSWPARSGCFANTPRPPPSIRPSRSSTGRDGGQSIGMISSASWSKKVQRSSRRACVPRPERCERWIRPLLRATAKHGVDVFFSVQGLWQRHEPGYALTLLLESHQLNQAPSMVKDLHRQMF